MGNFSNVVVTDAGRQLINSAIGASQQVVIATAQVGSGYPATGTDPADLTGLINHVADATLTSANDQVLYQTTVRISVSSEFAPYQYQLNEIGVFAQLGTNAPILFAYAYSEGQGDYITPDPSPTPVVYDYAILIQYEADSPVVATITIQPVIELHGATHRGNGIDPIGLADSTASGLLMSPPNSATKVLLGTVPQSWGPSPLHAPTHLDNGTDPIPVATTTRTGSMAKLSGNQSDCFAGDGSWQMRFLPSGVMMDFPASVAPTGWLICNGAAISRSTYAALFAAIGTAFGPGDGSTTFNLPDCRGRTVIGAGQGAGLTNRALGATGGEEKHTVTAAEMPSHTHAINDPGHIHPVNEGSGHTHTIADPGHTHALNEGGGHTHGVTQNPHAHGVNDPEHTHTIASNQVLTKVSSGLVPTYGTGPNPSVWATIVLNPALTGIGILPALASLGINAATTGASIVAALSRVTANLAATGMTIVSQLTGITIQPAGGTAPGSNVMQPFIVVNKIIKT